MKPHCCDAACLLRTLLDNLEQCEDDGCSALALQRCRAPGAADTTDRCDVHARAFLIADDLPYAPIVRGLWAEPPTVMPGSRLRTTGRGDQVRLMRGAGRR
jgi:hypothetical protein